MPEDIKGADLSLTTCLVVEDQPLILGLLSSTLSMLSVGRVLVARSAAEAVDLIQRIEKTPTQVGVSNIDFAVIDWNLDGDAFRQLSSSEFFGAADVPEEDIDAYNERPPVQGVELAKWIRRNEATVFMPLLAVSAYSNAVLIDLVRDSGMNGFVAKPFSVSGIARHVQRIVQDVIPHIITPSGYLGPERRRANRLVEAERRVSRAGVKSISPPRTLRNKTSGSVKVSGENVAEIMNQMENLATPDYLEDVKENLVRIKGFMSGIDFENADSEENMRLFREIDCACNEILGHQGCFTYQMIAEAVSGISRFIGDKYFLPNEKAYSLIRQQVAAAQVIASKKMKGPSNRDMRQLFATTLEVMNKVLMRNRKRSIGLTE